MPRGMRLGPPTFGGGGVKKTNINLNPLPHNLKFIIIGLILGDLNCQKGSINTRLRFEQSIAHKDYLMHIYELLKDYCNSSFTVRSRFDKRSQQTYESVDLRIFRLQLPLFLMNSLNYFIIRVKKEINHLSD